MRGVKREKTFWIRRTHLFRADEYICSFCGASFDSPMKRCPECGALNTKTKYDPSWVDEAEEYSAIMDDD